MLTRSTTALHQDTTLITHHLLDLSNTQKEQFAQLGDRYMTWNP